MLLSKYMEIFENSSDYFWDDTTIRTGKSFNGSSDNKLSVYCPDKIRQTDLSYVIFDGVYENCIIKNVVIAHAECVNCIIQNCAICYSNIIDCKVESLIISHNSSFIDSDITGGLIRNCYEMKRCDLNKVYFNSERDCDEFEPKSRIMVEDILTIYD